MKEGRKECRAEEKNIRKTAGYGRKVGRREIEGNTEAIKGKMKKETRKGQREK